MKSELIVFIALMIIIVLHLSSVASEDSHSKRSTSNQKFGFPTESLFCPKGYSGLPGVVGQPGIRGPKGRKGDTGHQGLKGNVSYYILPFNIWIL